MAHQATLRNSEPLPRSLAYQRVYLLGRPEVPISPAAIFRTLETWLVEDGGFGLAVAFAVGFGDGALGGVAFGVALVVGEAEVVECAVAFVADGFGVVPPRALEDERVGVVGRVEVLELVWFRSLLDEAVKGGVALTTKEARSGASAAVAARATARRREVSMAHR
jgi:hypothetical protein